MKIVLLLTHVESPPFKSMRDGILPLAKERDWAVHILPAASFAQGSALVKAWNPDGCIVYAAPESGLSGRFVSWRRPVVTLNAPRPVRGIAGIVHDSSATGSLAARELAALNLDNFAFYSAVEGQPWAEKRFESFTKGIARRGLKVVRYQTGDLGEWLESLPKPCGLFAANDVSAERLASTAFARGIAIPQDIALIGCDDDPAICEHAETTLSSIRMDFPKCTRLAVEALACAMEGRPYAGETVYGDTGVTHRASTRRIAAKHPALVSSMLEYIRLNALAGIGVRDVVGRFGASRRTLEYRFRKATGRSILEEIQSVRLAEAKRLVSNPAIKLGSIASRVGYASENFFERLFKKHTGLSMRDWRRKG